MKIKQSSLDTFLIMLVMFVTILPLITAKQLVFLSLSLLLMRIIISKDIFFYPKKKNNYFYIIYARYFWGIFIFTR